MEGIINLPAGTNGAPNAYAYTTNGQVFLFNEVDLIISNSPTGLANTKGTNITIWFQDNLQANALTPITKDFYVVTNRGSGIVTTTNYVNPGNTNVIFASFSFVTNVAFYDYRETRSNQAVQIDVSKLNIWLTNSSMTGGNHYNLQNFTDKGRGIDSIFIYNSVPMTASQLPSVRLVNGAQLPYTTDPGGTGRTMGGLTVVTPQPLYVLGNYNVQTNGGAAGASAGTTNTANTYPAALMADAITILSSSWRDTYGPNTTLALRAIPSATTINAACLEGIVQSTNSNYSGGLENFLRLEEDWGNNGGTKIVLTYNGSIVVMFPSQYATGFWPNTGSVYNPPIRNWAFDLNFTNPNKLPPLTPMVVNYVTP